jgi:hypothetical protein
MRSHLSENPNLQSSDVASAALGEPTSGRGVAALFELDARRARFLEAYEPQCREAAAAWWDLTHAPVLYTRFGVNYDYIPDFIVDLHGYRETHEEATARHQRESAFPLCVVDGGCA